MIFKTFDSNIDKISSKWGMFGRSFNDIGTAIVGRITDINKAFQATGDLIGSIKDSDTIWKRLYPSKESIKNQLNDVDSLIPEIDKNKFDFDFWIDKLNGIDKKVKAGTMSWQDFSNSLDYNQKWIAKWGQETEGQIRTQNNLVKANQQARASALAHNEAIKAQTLSAKAGSVALKALSIAANMIAFTLITKGIQIVVSSINNWIHSIDVAKKELEDANENLKEINSEIETTASRIDELNAKKNLSLVEAEELEKLKTTNAELERELRIREEIAKIKGEKANKEALLYFNPLSGSFGESFWAQLKEDILSFNFLGKGSLYESTQPHFYNKVNEAEYYINQAETLKQKLAEITDKESKEYKSISAAIAVIESKLSKTILEFMEKDDLLIAGKDNGLLDRLNALYEKYDVYNNGRAYVVENKLSSILAKVDFKDSAKELEELGKSGKLSIDILSSKFSDLISYLNEAGISAQELYQYIMALSNPDAINYDEVRKQLLTACGIRDGEVNGAPDQRTFNKLESAGVLSNKSLEAFITVKAKYNISEFDVDDFIYYIQQELDANPETPEISLSLSTILTTSTDSLDKFQSSVKSAADAYTTLLSGNYSSSELLDSIQTINQAVSDMGGTLDWEFINKQSTMDSLELLGGAIELISEDYAKSVLSGAGINENNEFYQMLADIIKQTYEVEAQFNGMNSQLDRLQSSYQTLTGILESYNETGYINLDNLQSLLTADENLIAMLEVENGQLVINQAAYENLVATQLLEFKAKLNDAAAAEIEALAKNKSEEATNNNAQASEDAVAKLDAETEAFGRNTSAAIDNAMAKAEEDGVSEEEIQGVLNKYNEIWNAAMNNYSTDFPKFMNGAKSSGEAAGKSAGEAFTEALDKELAALDKNLEAGYIDFNDYIQSRLTLIEDYYNQGKLSADEYYSYLEKHYDTQLSYMDKVVNAVTSRIDTELDALKQQKEDVESFYNAQIESLEKQKTLLEEANQERQRQIDLQKSLYDLERAKNQRTKLVYTEDEGMHYVADDQSIRDAQENVDNARHDIQIAEIEKSISNLEKARDKETDAIDEMISNLEAYKDAWNDITSAYEEEQENLIAAQILGADWETDILNGRLDVLDAFKDQYIGIQQAMAAAAWESANEQVKAAKEAEKGSSGSTNNKAPKIEGTNDPPQLSKTSSGGGGGGLGGNKLTYTSLTAYASGTNNAKKGLNLVGEDGPEAYFDNHGHVAIVTKPTLIPMEGGEVVKNERDTKKLLDPDNLAPVDTISVLTPIQPGSFMWDLQEKFNAYINKMGEDISSVMAPVDFIQKDMARSVNSISTANNVTNAGMQQVTIGDIHVTCPGVTSQEVARQVGVELNKQFSGFSLVALQESKK